MPNLQPGQKFNAVFRLEGRADTGEFKLTVEYYSNEPPAKHEELHERLKRTALQWLISQGGPARPDLIQIKYMGREVATSPAEPESKELENPAGVQKLYQTLSPKPNPS